MANQNTLSLGDRMKKYEEVLDYKLNPCMQYMIRLDGKNFSKMIKKWKCEKPFDERFNNAMTYAAKQIFDLIPNIHLIWHGSDEISVWFSCPNAEDMYYEGRIQKLISLISSQVSVNFNKKLQEAFKQELPFGIFDARIMQFPNEIEVANCFLFRQRDHIKNSISGYAQYYFSHKELVGKNSTEKIEMMKSKGFDYNLLSEDKNWSKYGTFLYKNIANVFKNSGEMYTRTYIEKNTNLNIEYNKIALITKNEIKSFTEEDWKNLKEI
jgi:tRNA(His) 5'-end guanylyltransferase